MIGKLVQPWVWSTSISSDPSFKLEGATPGVWIGVGWKLTVQGTPNTYIGDGVAFRVGINLEVCLVGLCLCWTPQWLCLLPSSEQPSGPLHTNPLDHQSLVYYLWWVPPCSGLLGWAPCGTWWLWSCHHHTLLHQPVPGTGWCNLQPSPWPGTNLSLLALWALQAVNSCYSQSELLSIALWLAACPEWKYCFGLPTAA